MTFGSEHELEMFHDGSNSYIKQRFFAYPSRLKIISENNGIDIMSGSGGNMHGGYENAISCEINGATKIYHAGVGPYFETYGAGVMFQGSIQVGQDIIHHTDADTKIRFPLHNTISFETTGNERLRIHQDGQLLVGGVTAARTLLTNYTPRLQIEGTDKSSTSASLTANANSSVGPSFWFAKTRGTSIGSNTVVQDDDELGTIVFNGADGTDVQSMGAYIRASVDGTPGSNDMPGRLQFHTATGGTMYERLRITSGGHLGVGDNNPDTRLSVTAASGTDVVGKFTSTDANAWIQFRDNSTTDTAVMVGASGDNLLLRAGSNTRARILSGGEFAIGGSGYAGQPFSLQTSSTNLGYMETTSTTRGVMSFRDGNSTQNIGFGAIGNNHVFMKDGNEKVRIDSSGHLKLPDDAHIRLGGSQTGTGDLKIYHDSSANFNNIQSVAGNNLRIRQQQNGAGLYLAATHIYLQNHDNNQTYIHAQNNGSVTLNHSGNSRAYTVSDGFHISRVNTFSNPNNTGSETQGAMIDLGGNIHFKEIHPVGAYTDRCDLVLNTNSGYGLGLSDKLRITAGGQVLVHANTGWNESSALISLATDAATGANMLSDSSAIYNHNNPAFIHIQNRYNTGTGQEAGIILHSKSSYNGSWAIYSKRTTSSYLADLIFRNRTGASSSSERLHLHGNGDITFNNCSTTIDSSNYGMYLLNDSNTTKSVFLRQSREANGTHSSAEFYGNQGAMKIYGDGDVKNTNNSYGQLSDETLKQDIVDASSQWDDIKAIKVRKFRFKDNPTGVLQIGVIAQELETVSPKLVTEVATSSDDLTSTETVKAVKYSVLYMKAIKALQEAQTRIETLEAKVSALEG